MTSLDYRFQPFFKFSFVFGSGNQKLPWSREKDLFCFLGSRETSPRTIRCAQSLRLWLFLPVPGFTYQDRIVFGSATQKSVITRLISSSRPITGSSFPLRARSFQIDCIFCSMHCRCLRPKLRLLSSPFFAIRR